MTMEKPGGSALRDALLDFARSPEMDMNEADYLDLVRNVAADGA